MSMQLEQRFLIDAALSRYGAKLTDDGFITKPEKTTSVQIKFLKGRMRMFGGAAGELASYPAGRIEAGVKDFVEKFWYWKPKQ